MKKQLYILFSMGFYIITPLLVSIYLSIYLQQRYDLPQYVVILGIFSGIFSGVFSLCKTVFKKGS